MTKPSFFALCLVLVGSSALTGFGPTVVKASTPVGGDDASSSSIMEEPTCSRADGSSCDGPDDESQQVNRQSSPPQCSLYYAPSTTPGAGWGLFTAVDLPEDTLVGGLDMDIVLPIYDTKKTLPFRGNQRFLPWLSYVWPEEVEAFFGSSRKAFPKIELGQFKMDEGLSFATKVQLDYAHDDIHDTGNPMNVFLPGIASQANSDKEFDNIVFREPVDADDEGQFASYDSRRRNDGSARSRYYHHGLVTETFVPAGSELFLYYGNAYHNYLHRKRNSDQEFQDLDYYKENWDFSIMPTEEYKRGLLNETSKRLRDDVPIHEERGMTPTPKSNIKRFIKPQPRRKEPPGRSLEWLATNGVCVDNLKVQDSDIPRAGRGAFTTRKVAEGQVVSHAPLLHLKRDDLVIYATKKRTNKYDVSTKLDFDKVLGQELLLNYCFGHPDSQLLLVPYSPIVNYINHDGAHPNTMIRWVKDDEKTAASMELHPIDVLEQQSGSLRMEYVALRDIEEGEEITIDYGVEWEEAWKKFVYGKKKNPALEFRHEIGVPEDFYPEKWLHVSVKYELVPKGDLAPGELKPVLWKHNGKQVSRYAYHVGLVKGFSKTIREYSEDAGIMAQYDRLLKTGELPSDRWYLFNATDDSVTGAKRGEFFIQPYKNEAWKFNMHYVAAWDETARRNLLSEIGKAGFDDALNGIGNHFNLDSITCFHASYMGVSKSDYSFTHADFYATGEVGYSIIFPLELVEGSEPELHLQTDDATTVIGVKYDYDTAMLMGDYVYHFTSAIGGYKEGEKRVVIGMSCGQIDENNKEMMAYLYDGEDPSPFMGQFDLPIEWHWSRGNLAEHRMSRL